MGRYNNTWQIGGSQLSEHVQQMTGWQSIKQDRNVPDKH